MILNEDRIRRAAEEARNQRKDNTYNYSATHFDTANAYDLFISHSFKDKDLVIGLYHLFTVAGYNVYIDWIDDPALDRNSVTAGTAATIRRRIACSKGLSYISTGNSTTSKWCPWELGVADGMHNRVCILPIMNSTKNFKGQEYLGLYPYLAYERVEGQSRYDFWVFEQIDSRKYINLRTWLTGYNPYVH